MTREDLLVWASQERAESLRQLDLFGSVGIKGKRRRNPALRGSGKM